MYAADSKNYVIATAVASAYSAKNSSQMQKVGLVDSHAYSLISAHEETDDSGNPVKLVKIRNPWG